MGRLRTIERTAAFAWSPGKKIPLLATGTRSGAVSDDFSNETKLELWDLGLDKAGEQLAPLVPVGTISTDSGFNDLAWSEPTEKYPLGVIAGALENGSVDLWDASKLRSGDSNARISRQSKHSGAAKALQFNPIRHGLLASVGTKGEIFMYDLEDMDKSYRLGASAARADDIECLDWNKTEKTAHILATGSSGGFVTVWDAKQKKDVLTLNNQGRKAVSAVAWDPQESTKLAMATPSDQDAAILLWSLRNSSAPEQTLKGHELGVLGLSWCVQDPDLLLSCGKDNRTICWNPRTGERYGDFAAGTNWVFQTGWNPHNPSLIASASFDGKILITTIQATNSTSDEQNAASQALDGDDFFAKAQTQSTGISFSLPNAPRWASRPSSVSFGFGGKLVRVDTHGGKSKVSLDVFEIESSIGEAAQKFDDQLRTGDVASICQTKIQQAKTDEEKADWQVIETLNTGKSRKKLCEHMGFSDIIKTDDSTKANGDVLNSQANSDKDDFFGGADGDSFLADLALSKGAKTNNPFSIYTGSESDADKSISQALMLGQFERALDVCLREERMSDAFMIAVCGGQKCIDKAQNAYLKKMAKGPNYLRLLASIVGKNLWDVVHNADLQNWKEVMATLCTYADEREFSDLCEALGDRLEEAYQQSAGSTELRRDASFCYLAGSKLEKVVNNWVQELREQEKTALAASESENIFAVHAKCLQDFVEKVSVFRQVAKFQDAELQSTAEWKLSPLYTLYVEYADILAASGQLASAEQYVALLPSKFNGADSAQQRMRQATRKATAPVAQRQAGGAQRAPSAALPTQPAQQSYAPGAPLINQARNAPLPYAPANTIPSPQGLYAPTSNAYTPAGYQVPQPAAPYAQPAGSYGGYQPPQQQAPLAPPPRASAASPSTASSAAAKNMTVWNDMPENFLKDRQPNSRRGTPGPQPVISPFPNAQSTIPTSPPAGPSPYGQQRQAAPLPPPPRAGEVPHRVASPLAGPPQMHRIPSAATSAYAPSQSSQAIPGSTLPPPISPPVARGASPYQPPPSISSAAPSNRYAPAPGTQPSYGPGGMPPQRTVAPNPYAAQQQGPYMHQQPQQPQSPYGQPPQANYGQAPQQVAPPPSSAPPPRGPSRAPPPVGPPPSAASRNGPAPSSQQQSQTPSNTNPSAAVENSPPPPSKPKYPRGDRSHIPATAQPIVDSLLPEIARIKGVAPPAFKPQVDDMEKRINILFDHLNNDDLLQPDTVQQMVQLARCIREREWDRAQGLFAEMNAAKLETEGTHWMVGIKRLIAIARATK